MSDGLTAIPLIEYIRVRAGISRPSAILRLGWHRQRYYDSYQNLVGLKPSVLLHICAKWDIDQSRMSIIISDWYRDHYLQDYDARAQTATDSNNKCK